MPDNHADLFQTLGISVNKCAINASFQGSIKADMPNKWLINLTEMWSPKTSKWVLSLQSRSNKNQQTAKFVRK